MCPCILCITYDMSVYQDTPSLTKALLSTDLRKAMNAAKDGKGCLMHDDTQTRAS